QNDRSRGFLEQRDLTAEGLIAPHDFGATLNTLAAAMVGRGPVHGDLQSVPPFVQLVVQRARVAGEQDGPLHGGECGCERAMEVFTVGFVRVVAAATACAREVGRVKVEDRVGGVVRGYDLQGIPVFDDDRAEPVGQRVEPVDEVSGRGGVRVIHPYAVGPACPAAGSGGVVALGGADEEAAGSLQVVDGRWE